MSAPASPTPSPDEAQASRTEDTARPLELWPTSPPPAGQGPVDEPVAGSAPAPSARPTGGEHPHPSGYLAQTYPAQGFGVQPEEPPAPWSRGSGFGAHAAYGPPAAGQYAPDALAPQPPAPYPPAYGAGPAAYLGAPQPYGVTPPYPGASAPGPAGPPGPASYPPGYDGHPGPASYPPGYDGYPGPASYPLGYDGYAGPAGPYGPGYGAPVPYGNPAYGWAAPPPPYDGMSIAALLTGTIGLLTCVGVAAGPVALGLGIAGLRRVQDRGTRGRGLAVTGIVTGAVGTLIMLAFVMGLAADPQAFLR